LNEKKEFKEKLYEVFEINVDDFDFDGKVELIENILLDYQKDNEDKRDVSNKGQKWTDEELKVILSDAPTKKLYEVC
jgi:parvulin-like peptidyl-prolyl isomerase